MTKRIIASEIGLEPHYKVRIVIPGGILHLASRTEPRATHNPLDAIPCVSVEADWIDDHEYGDTLGWIRWRDVAAVSWRFSP